ncbi:ParA family protein [Mucilaginibacter limnophilus]|uniref:ParA family protein n=1 Tax=Mucilaginibacter limnophilus TaxID=1932778 RepID=A0A437MXN2_9SPHI|nr:AAA family ATPase [Mucilaginibacter limnophilus]RVU02379.1 ParA family protein [Mucilaginibacter limnophilus]
MKVISLINMKGGVGKTTLSVNVCDCLARRHNVKVLLVDVDPQFNATQCLMSGEDYVKYLKEDNDTILSVFDRNSRAMVSSVSGTTQRPERKLEDIKPYRVKKNFDLLPGNLELYRMEMTPGEGRENRLSKFLKEQEAKQAYDYVIIDTPPTPSVWMTSALLASNYYLIPVKPDPISFTGIDLLQGIIDNKKENYDLSIQCAGIVLTIVEENTRVYKQAVQNLDSGRWKTYRYAKSVPKRTEIARTQTNKGYILDLHDNESKFALTGIVAELIERTKDER